MCGIFGVIDRKVARLDRSFIRPMVETLAHRGPDNTGYWCEGSVGLGHQRLSIIDPSESGDQPMVSNCGRFILVYNGVVYNAEEIRKELIELGYNFRSSSDTEVVLNALIQWGEAVIPKFNGMFALALWDKSERKLFIARDRYGIKPFYYTRSDDFFIFASEQKAIIKYPRFSRQLNRESLLEYFTFQNLFTNNTFFKNINILPAGHVGCYQEELKRFDIRCYWDFDFREPNQQIDKRESIEELRSLFSRAVNRQLYSDVEVGAYLSGGLDSSAIVSIASKHIPEMKTFTCGFDMTSVSGAELTYDESSIAKSLSSHFGTRHFETILKAGDLERCISSLVYHIEDPRVGQSYPNYYASQLAGHSVKVCLSGCGGDELFGGYPWRYYQAIQSQNFTDYIDNYYLYWKRLADNSELIKLFKPIAGDVKNVWTRDIFDSVFNLRGEKVSSPQEYVNYSLYFEAKTFLHGLLIVEDKISMAHGLEVRLPFLDNDVVDFAMKCPVDLKLSNLSQFGYSNEKKKGVKQEEFIGRTSQGKQILRDSMAGLVPSEILCAPKQGFSAPDASWFKGESYEYIERVLLGKDALIFDFLDRKMVHRLVRDHIDGRSNRRLLLWSFLNFEEWLRIFLSDG